MNYKNLKIAINEDQSIDEVVRELERLGYYCGQFYFHISNHRDKSRFKSVACYVSGDFYYYSIDVELLWDCELTTLAELKGMK